MKFLDIYIEDTFLYNTVLTYRSGIYDVEVGARVEFMMNQRLMVGLVRAVKAPYDTSFQVLPILRVVDEAPILNEELMALGETLAYQTVSPIMSVYKSMLPLTLKPSSKARQIRTQKIVVFKSMIMDLTKKQQEFLTYVSQQPNQSMRLTEARTLFSNVALLEKKGALSIVEAEVRMIDTKAREHEMPLHQLSKPQQEIVDAIDLTAAKTVLLKGVTGSGKTEVYMHLAKKVLESGKSVLFCVPEIALTQHMIDRLTHHFSSQIAVYHSGLSEQARYEYYRHVMEGKAMIALGTRSAIFLPFKSLGLIILDEEHDSSYKQQQTPYFHTRDVAKIRSQTHQCPLILGSASPSLDTYARAYKGVYDLYELPSRFNESKPNTMVVDTTQARDYQGHAYFTKPLVDAIARSLSRNEQVMLLLNRRGYLPILKDRSTNEVLMCDACEVALTYHKEQRVLKCHQCGKTVPVTNEHAMRYVGYGVGTQKIVESLNSLFPNATIGRLDRDSVKDMPEIMNQFKAGTLDILVGTQMIAKGHDIENVTCVGVLNADASLVHTDFASIETTFSLVLQACGRSGRGAKEGVSIVQTSNPQHYAITCAVNEDYDRFFAQEMQYRHLANYPPYSYVISVVFSDTTQEGAQQAAAQFFIASAPQGINVIGPTDLRKLSHRYRSRVIIRGKNLESMLEFVHPLMTLFKKHHRTGVVVDVNPINLESI